MGRDHLSRLVTPSPRSFVERRRHRRYSALESAASFELAQLEARLLYCLDGSSPNHVHGDEHGNLPVQIAGPFVTSTPGPQYAGSPLSSIPALNSLASAGANLFAADARAARTKIEIGVRLGYGVISREVVSHSKLAVCR